MYISVYGNRICELYMNMGIVCEKQVNIFSTYTYTYVPYAHGNYESETTKFSCFPCTYVLFHMGFVHVNFIWDSCMWILFAQQLNSVISHVHMCHVHTGYVHVNFIHIGIVYVNQYSNSASIFAQQLNSVVFTYTYGLYSYGYRICETTEQRTIFIWELCIWNNWIEDRKCRVLCLCCDIFTCDSCMWKKEKI